MKTNELMIGDIVLASTYEEEVDDEVFHPARITAISSIQELFDGNWNIEWLDDCASESCGDIQPIPLTDEILAANKLLLGKNIIDRYQEPDNDSFIYLHKETIDTKDVFEIHWAFGAIIRQQHICDRVLFNMSMHYVHELQHALRLCGLNDIADNFKLYERDEVIVEWMDNVEIEEHRYVNHI